MNKGVYSQDIIGRRKALPSIWRLYWCITQIGLGRATVTNKSQNIISLTL